VIPLDTTQHYVSIILNSISYLVIDRYCLPDISDITDSVLSSFKDSFFGEISIDKFSEYVSDLISVWYVMAISVGSAFILGMFFMLFMRCCAGVIVFFSLIGVFVLIAGGAAWLYLRGRCWYVENPSECKYIYAPWSTEMD